MSLKSLKREEIAFDFKNWRNERTWKFETLNFKGKSWQYSLKGALKEVNDHWKALEIRWTSLKRESNLTRTRHFKSES